jgi:hypothetical protein
MSASKPPSGSKKKRACPGERVEVRRGEGGGQARGEEMRGRWGGGEVGRWECWWVGWWCRRGLSLSL